MIEIIIAFILFRFMIVIILLSSLLVLIIIAEFIQFFVFHLKERINVVNTALFK